MNKIAVNTDNASAGREREVNQLVYNRNIMKDFHAERNTHVDLIAETRELEKLREGLPLALPLHELLARIINKTAPRRAQVRELNERYNLNSIPVLHEREVCDPNDIDNRLANDFFGEIAEGKAGYFLGKPMHFVFNDEATTAEERFNDFKKRNNLDALLYQLTQKAAIGGYASMLMHVKAVKRMTADSVSVETELAAKLIPAWQTIFLGGEGIDTADFGIRYYDYLDINNAVVHRVELYMPFEEHIFEGASLSELAYVADEGEFIEGAEGVRDGIRRTMFSSCPLVGYPNNPELLGDVERVITLIDDYDRTMSDTSSELEANRGAILLFIGVDPPKNGDEWDSKSSSAAYLPNRNKDIKQDAKFITKDLPSAAKEAHLERVEDNIYRFARQPNMSEKKTGIAVSGEALKQRMSPLENKVAAFERLFSSSNMRMLSCVRDFFYFVDRTDFDAYDVEQKFVRNMPYDTKYEAETLVELLETFPSEKAYAMSYLSDNPREDAEWFDEKGESRFIDMVKEGYDGATVEGVTTASGASDSEGT